LARSAVRRSLTGSTGGGGAGAGRSGSGSVGVGANSGRSGSGSVGVSANSGAGLSANTGAGAGSSTPELLPEYSMWCLLFAGWGGCHCCFLAELGCDATNSVF